MKELKVPEFRYGPEVWQGSWVVEHQVQLCIQRSRVVEHQVQLYIQRSRVVEHQFQQYIQGSWVVEHQVQWYTLNSDHGLQNIRSSSIQVSRVVEHQVQQYTGITGFRTLGPVLYRDHGLQNIRASCIYMDHEFQNIRSSSIQGSRVLEHQVQKYTGITGFRTLSPVVYTGITSYRTLGPVVYVQVSWVVEHQVQQYTGITGCSTLGPVHLQLGDGSGQDTSTDGNLKNFILNNIPIYRDHRLQYIRSSSIRGSRIVEHQVQEHTGITGCRASGQQYTGITSCRT